MSRTSKGIWFSALAALLFLAMTVTLAVRPTPQEPALSRDISAQVPPPVGTYYPPTSSPAPIEPTWTPSPVPPPPNASAIAGIAGEAPNIAWGSITDNSLTVWAGRYIDSPLPTLASAWPVARWNMPLDVTSMAVSPDHRYLAILTIQRCFPPTPEPTPTPDYSHEPPAVFPSVGEYCLGDWPQYIYVIDLLANQVQPIPDYYRDYELYAQNSYPYYSRIMGWFDNDRFGIMDRSNELITATKDGLSFVAQPFPDLGPFSHPYELVLLPDRRTLFAWTDQGFHLRDAPTGAVRKVGSYKPGEGLYAIAPSPDGKQVAYVKADFGIEDNRTVRDESYVLWVQDLNSGQSSLVAERKTAFGPLVWSSDSSQIAFLPSEPRPAEDARSLHHAYDLPSNIYLTSIADKQVRRLTSFSKVSNRQLFWTPSGNLILTSTFGSQTGETGIVTISPQDGSANLVRQASPGEALVALTLFEPQLPTGMPGVGADPDQP